MKNGFLCYLFFLSFNCLGQTYNSTHTVYLPQQEREEIQRVVIIREGFILVKSYVNDVNVDNQAWKIHKHWEEGEDGVFHLISMDESHSIRMYIKRNNPQYIEVHQPLEDNSIQRLQLVLEVYQ